MRNVTQISINTEKCIGCGLCVDDCTRNIIHLNGKKAEVENSLCIECGHCVAVCPEGAVKMRYYNDDEVLEYKERDFHIESGNLLNFMKFRRSIRSYGKQQVEDEKLNAIIEAGRYAPTGANRQTNRYIVLSDKIKEIKEITLRTLYDIANDKNSELSKQWVYYHAKWTKMYNDYVNLGIDRLFYDAPKVIVIVGADFVYGSVDIVNGGLAASYMELMANAQNLGVCYIGFFQLAVEFNPELKKMLNIGAKEEIITTMAVGYPNISYKRTVNRKAAKADIF